MTNNLPVIAQRDVLGKEFKIYGNIDNPLFLARDVAEWIEYNPNDINKMLAVVDANDKQTRTIFRSGQNRECWFLSEDGLYEVLMQSRKAIAKEFRKQVKQILKDIRRHGIYATNSVLENMLTSPDFGIKLLTELKVEREKLSMLEGQVKEDKPKVIFANAVEASKDSIFIGDLAKIIKQNGADIGQRRLFEWLRQNNYLMKCSSSKNIPTQRSMEMKLFEVEENVIFDPDGSVRVAKTPKVTGKGQVYFINRFLSEENQTA